ncbi:sulfolactaldehyde 3-reductase [Microbacterium invictum]
MSGAERLPRLGVIGLGQMGLPITAHLVRAGFATAVFDVDPERVRMAGEAGAVAAPDAHALAADVDILITVLPGAPEFASVMSGADGAIARLRAGAGWLDLTSNDPRVAEHAASESSSRGVWAVGAPMGGGVGSAETGMLEFFVGGDVAARARCEPVLQVLARPGGIRDAGPAVASGYTAKLLINQLWFTQVAAYAEAALLWRALGNDPAWFEDLVTGSAADSTFVRDYAGRLRVGDYAASFGLDRCIDEIDIVSDLADDRQTPFDVGRVIQRLHHDALDRYGAVDGEMLVAKMLEERAGG